MYGKAGGDLYAAEMVKRMLIGVQDFRTYLRARLEAVEAGEHSVLARRGKPVAVMVPIEWYRRAADALNEPTEY